MVFWLIVQVAAAVILVFFVALRLYLSPPTRWCKSQRCLLGKTVLITGANSGIGYEAALDFAKRGAKVILGCRDKSRAEKAQKQIKDLTNNPQIFIKLVDMSSFASVRAFAKEMYETEDRLDILVNNAGISYYHGKKTIDGYDFVMQVNYYSHYLLTILLLDLMNKSKEPSRIVNTSSLAAAFAIHFDVNNIHKFKTYFDPYSNSKLCNILFTKELAERLQNTQITTYSLHPGAIKTDIFRDTKSFARMLIEVVVALFYKRVEEGAQTTVYCAVEKGIEKWSGCHFDNCRKVGDYRVARSRGLPTKLWAITEEIVQLKNHEKFKFD